MLSHPPWTTDVRRRRDNRLKHSAVSHHSITLINKSSSIDLWKYKNNLSFKSHVLLEELQLMP